MEDIMHRVTQKIICEAVEGQEKTTMVLQQVCGDKLKQFTIDKNKVAEAVAKQIPKYPIGDLHSVPHFRCPSCWKTVKTYANSLEMPYCGWCGQALDWDDTWK